MKETEEEFTARMDRAREASAREANWRTILGLAIYGGIFGAVYLFRTSDWHAVYYLLLGVNLLLAVIAASLLIGIARSSRPPGRHS